MPFFDTIDKSVLEHLATITTWNSRTNDATYLALSSSTPAKSAASPNVTEPSGSGYARVQVTRAMFAAAAATVGAVTTLASDTDIVFAACTGSPWVGGANLTYGVLYDAVTSGNPLAYFQLSTPRAVLVGDTAKVLAGDLKLILQ